MEEARIAIGERVEVEGAGIPSGKNMRGVVTGPNPRRRDGVAAYFKNWYVVRLDDGFEAGYDSRRVRRLTPLEALAEIGTTSRKNPVDEHLQVGDRIEIRDRFGKTQRGTVVGLDDRWAPIVITDQGLKRAVVRKALRKLTPLELLAEVGQKNPKNKQVVRPGNRVRTQRSQGFGDIIEHGTVQGVVSDMFTFSENNVVVHLDSGLVMSFPESCVTALSPMEELAAIAPKAKRNPAFEVGDRIESMDKIGGLGRGTVLEVPLHWPWVYAKLDSGHDRIMLLQRQIRKLTPIEALAELAPKAKKNGFFQRGDRVIQRYTPARAKNGVGTVVETEKDLLHAGYVSILFDSGSTATTHTLDLMHISPLEELAAVAPKAKSNPADDLHVGDRIREKSTGQKGTVTLVYPMTHVLVKFDRETKSLLCVARKLEPLSDLELLAEVVLKKTKNNPRGFQIGDRVAEIRAASRAIHGVGTVVGIDKRAIGREILVRFDAFPDDVVGIYFLALTKVSPLEELASLAPKKAKNNGGRTFLPAGTRVVVKRASRPRSGWLGTVQSERLPPSFQKVVFDDGYVAYIDPVNMDEAGPLDELAGTGKDNPWRQNFIKGQRVVVGRDRKPGTAKGTTNRPGCADVELDSGETYNYPHELLRTITPAEELALIEASKPYWRPVKAKAEDNSGKRFSVGDRVRWLDTMGVAWSKIGVGTVVQIVEERHRGQDVSVVFDKTSGRHTTHSNNLMLVNPLEELAEVGAKTKNNPKPIFLPGDRVRMCKRFDPKASDVIGTVQFDPVSSKEPNVVIVQWDAGSRSYTGRLHLVRVSPLEDLAALARKNPNSLIGRRVAMLSPHSGKHSRGTIEATYNGGAQYYVKMDTGQVWRLYPHEVQLLTDIEVLAEAHRK